MDLRKAFHTALKKHQGKKECLHYDAGENCNKVISAHSIQRNKHLRDIAEDGEVYMMSADWTVLRKNNHRPNVKATGISKASTFHGFCSNHDNNTFAPIDNFPFDASEKQIALYLYRAICKEFHERNIAINTFSEIGSDPEFKSLPEASFLASTALSFALGQDRLLWHKEATRE